MHKPTFPDLTFPMVEYGERATRWDLRPLLYIGGAKTDVRTVFVQISSGELGNPINARLELVTRIHEVLTAGLVAGGSKYTTLGIITSIRTFFAWADQHEDQPLTIENVETAYRYWTDSLLISIRTKTITEIQAYRIAAQISGVIDRVLERSVPLIRTTRLRFPKVGARAAGGVASDKQNLSDTFAFGHFLIDIIDGLSGDAIWGPLPVRIPLRNGRVLEEWCRLRNPETLTSLVPGYKEKSNTDKVNSVRAAWESDRTMRTRSSLANLMLEAQLLVFIGQTSMNLSQAHRLKLDQFSYKSTIDGYEVRSYKHRRQGEVLFDIFAEYRPVFESYLAWRKKQFPSSVELFPIIRTNGRATSTAPKFTNVKRLCDRNNIRFITPTNLRKTRINWLLRKSRDPDLTAEHAQHTKEMLIRVYEQPSQQVAMAEMIQFWPDFDPDLRGEPQACPAPGLCNGVAHPIANIPKEAPKPDCSHPAGCLFCTHHRDIDSEDYVWSVASMRHLKTIVLAGFRPSLKDKPDSARHIELTLEVLMSKLKWFNESNEQRRGWVSEAIDRVDEADFHPHWKYLIESAESV